MKADPFAVIPDADPAELELRRPWVKKDNAVELVGKPRKKKTDFSPMQRRWFEQHGYTYARVEHANAFGAVNVDLWSFADWLAIRDDDTLLVQTCRHSDASKRERKARSCPELAAWLSGCGRRFEIHGWRQPDGTGTRWENVVRIVEKASVDENASPTPHNGQQAPSGVGCGQVASESTAGAESSLSLPPRCGRGTREKRAGGVWSDEVAEQEDHSRM